MEALADAVAAELAHHGKAIGLRVLLDGVADIAQRGPVLTCWMPFHMHSNVTSVSRRDRMDCSPT